MTTNERAGCCIYGDLINEGTSLHKMGMIIQGIDSREKYTMRFTTHEANPVAISVAPGTYKIQKVVCTYIMNDIAGHVMVDDPEYHKPFVVEPGKAHYIGSFKSTGQIGFIHTWSVDAADYNFEWCTERFRKKYPNAEGLVAKPLFFSKVAPRSTSAGSKKGFESQAVTSPDGSDLKERLKTLEELREQGLISVDEYRAKRAELLDGL